MTKMEIAEYLLNMPEERLNEIIEAEIEGRLKIRAKPLEETCGSCKHYQHEAGISTGLCDCRTVFDRRKGIQTGQTLYVTQSRKRCRDDYEPMEIEKR